MGKHHLQMVASFVLAGSLTACGSGSGSSNLPSVVNAPSAQNNVAQNNVAQNNVGASVLSSAAASTTNAGLSINAGGAASSSWIADADFNGGVVASVTNAINTSLVSSPAPQAVYQTQRYGQTISYTVPNLTPNSAYSVRLHFVESFFTAAGQRVFNIKLNGAPVATNFDIFAAAGGSNVAIVKTFNATADASGKVAIILSATVNNASIAGIQVTPGAVTAPPTPTPTPTSSYAAMLIDAGGSAAGSWNADTGYSGGWVASAVTAAVNTSLVSNPAPQAVYQTQRAGSTFSYAVGSLTPKTSYGVRLHFVESFFGATGQRVFNVAINGSNVLSNFDIFKSAGGRNIAVAVPFSATADASGKITIAFASTVNNATLAAIEVTSGSIAPPPTQAPSPTPVPTTAPTSVASPTPPPAGGAQWPAAGWVPYPVSPLTVRVSQNPTLDSSSAAVINAMWSGHQSDPGRIQVYSGPPPPDSNDYSQPLYFGHAGDPVYTVSCYDYGGNCPAKGVSVHIPKGAQPAGGTDHHIAIRDTVTGKDVMLWLAPIPNGNGGSFSVGWGTVISSTGDGLNAVGGSASGLSALWALRETDLAHNTVNHAIIVQINGESADGYVYPAVGWDNGFFHANPWPKMGAHFWLDVAPPYAAGCPQYAVSYLTALNKYGAFFADNGGVSTPFEANFESDVEYTYNGGASVWGPLMASLGGNRVGTSNLEMSACGINMQQHMHILTPPAKI
jgi:hypothetical protein